MFENAREKYKNSEYKLLVAKIIDKYNFSKNKIVYTDFLNISEISIVKKILLEESISNYIIYGGKEETDRRLALKLEEMAEER